MRLITQMRRQVAVYWSRATVDKYGRYAFSEPVEVKCRWEDAVEEYVSATGEKKVSQAVVYVDRVMQVGDRLWLGEMDSTTPSDPLELFNSYEIGQFEQTPDLKNRDILYVARL